jgi:hypothetical protein
MFYEQFMLLVLRFIYLLFTNTRKYDLWSKNLVMKKNNNNNYLIAIKCTTN